MQVAIVPFRFGQAKVKLCALCLAVVIDLAFTPATLQWHPALDVAVVIDVLRMTTNAAALFSHGLHELLVVAEEDEARATARATGALLYGERGGVALPGFHGGNSPLEHGPAVSGATALLCTTNGSAAVEAARGARALLLGAVVNARATALRALKSGIGRVTLVCAGTNGLPSLDDVIGAGCIARELLALEPNAEATDSTKMALALLAGQGSLATKLGQAAHAQVLRQLGVSEDIAFAARLNSLDLAPERVANEPATFQVLA